MFYIYPSAPYARRSMFRGKTVLINSGRGRTLGLLGLEQARERRPQRPARMSPPRVSAVMRVFLVGPGFKDEVASTSRRVLRAVNARWRRGPARGTRAGVPHAPWALPAPRDLQWTSGLTTRKGPGRQRCAVAEGRRGDLLKQKRWRGAGRVRSRAIDVRRKLTKKKPATNFGWRHGSKQSNIKH